MAKKLGELFTEIAEKAGISATDPRLKELQSVMTEVHDEIATAISNNLYNEYSVSNSQKFHDLFHKKIRKEILDGLDAKIKDSAKKNKFSDAELAEVENAKTTFERQEKIIEILNAKATAASQNSSGADKKALLDEIQNLKSELVKTNETYQSKEKELIAGFIEKQKQSLVRNYLAGKNFANKEIPKEVQIKMAEMLIADKLKEVGASSTLTDDSIIKLVQASKPELEYTEQHKPVKFYDFADKILADNKLLEVTDPNKSGAGEPNYKPVPPDPNLKPNLEGVSFFDQQLAAMGGN